MRYLAVAAWLAVVAAVPAAGEAAWSGRGAYRLLVTAPPRDLASRTDDMGPARLDVDFAAVLTDLGVEGRVAPGPIQVVQYDRATGEPMPYPDYCEDAPNDVPHRFDNAGLRGYSYMYNLLSDSQAGDLVWIHRQRGRRPSHYAVYFDLAAAGAETSVLPRPTLGDVDVIYRRSGGLMSSVYHTRPAVGDWDGDGRFDFLLGNILGHVFFHKNVGQPGRPAFAAGRMIHADETPVDVGWYAAPKLVDWDGDGDLDLLSGANGGKALWFENTGSAASPVLAARGPICAGGEPIVSPHAPCPETPFMSKDYVPVPDAVDWDGDGDLDFLLGGYVTGRVYYYENVRNGPGVPELEARGALEADGEPLDVLWQAAPCAVDLDDDGDLDLLCGTMDHRVHESRADPWPSFFYYENVGTRQEPKLARRPFPLDENVGNLTNPRAVDWDGDGALDIVVGVGCEVRLLRNVGDRAHPEFRAGPALTAPWMPLVTSGFAVPPVDWDGDGDVDFILSGSRTATYLENVRPGNPPDFIRRGPVTAGGAVIAHDFPLGDDHTFGDAFDWDRDGDLDYMLGNSAGHVWLYENVGTGRAWRLAPGKRFTLADGGPLLVGMPEDTPMTNFATHSGNRSDPAPGDFDGDGDHDLVVSDAYGKVTYFENVGPDSEPTFAAGRVLFEHPSRCVVCVVDWDADGLLDVLASWSGHGLWLYRNVGTGQSPEFARARRFELPWIPYPHPYALDWNRDGDLDLLIASSYSFVYFADRSFLDGGYAQATVAGVERRALTGSPGP